jgi:hypothetical protein
MGIEQFLLQRAQNQGIEISIEKVLKKAKITRPEMSSTIHGSMESPLKR